MTSDDHLVLDLILFLLIPVGPFIFAWTSRLSIHFLDPTIGVGVDTGDTVLILQCIFMYITLAYTQLAASLFIGNVFAKSMFEFCGVL